MLCDPKGSEGEIRRVLTYQGRLLEPLFFNDMTDADEGA
jgi:hypothetical protein